MKRKQDYTRKISEPKTKRNGISKASVPATATSCNNQLGLVHRQMLQLNSLLHFRQGNTESHEYRHSRSQVPARLLCLKAETEWKGRGEHKGNYRAGRP
jgi:hypothetical protein